MGVALACWGHKKSLLKGWACSILDMVGVFANVLYTFSYLKYIPIKWKRIVRLPVIKSEFTESDPYDRCSLSLFLYLVDIAV